MSEPTKILGKIGKRVGQELKDLQDQIDSIDLNNIQGNVDVTGDIDGVNLQATGDLTVGGHLECDSLLVKGETKVINTTKVELSDDILELNFASDGTAKSNTSGIAINQGTVYNVTDSNIFVAIGTPSSTSLTNAEITSQEDGLTDDNVPIVEYINFERTLDGGLTDLTATYMEQVRYIKDLNSGKNYALSYAYESTFFIKPFFSEDYDSTTYFDIENNTSITDNASRGWLRGFVLDYYDGTSSNITMKVRIMTRNYSKVVTTQPQLLWKNATNDWSVQYGNDLAELNGIFKAPDGSSILIDQVSLGNFSSFEDYLNDSL